MKLGRDPVVHVPTVAELAEAGLATPVGFTGGKATHWRITPAGQEQIYAAMRQNGER